MNGSCVATAEQRLRRGRSTLMQYLRTGISVTTTTKDPLQLQSTLAAVNLALQSAHNKAPRAAVGWAVLDSDENILSHGSVMAGIETQRAAMSVARFNSKIDHFVLTCEPSPGFFVSEKLRENLENSTCRAITIAHKLDPQLLDTEWLRWKQNSDLSVQCLQGSQLAKRLVSGLESVRTKYRPWVSVVSSAYMNNKPAPLTIFSEEFGFTSFVGCLVSQSRAHLVQHAQAAIVECLPEDNTMDELVDIFEVNTLDEVRSILRYCVQENRFSVLLSCDADFLAQLVTEDLVDEIYHHISIKAQCEASNIQSPPYINLNQWSLINTHTVGDAVRLQLQKKNDIPELFGELGNRLN